MWIIVFFLCGGIICSFKRFFALSRYREYSFVAKKTLSASKCVRPFYIFKIFLTTNQIIKIIKNDISNAAAGERYANLPFLT
jgi:hypothetical protein